MSGRAGSGRKHLQAARTATHYTIMRPVDTEMLPGGPRPRLATAARTLAGALALVLASAPAGAAVEIASHRAMYDIAMRESTSASPVLSVVGRTAYMMQRLCDGWQSVEDYAVSFGLENGRSDFVSHYEIWEAADGGAFSFSVHENSTQNGEARYNGFANLAEEGAEAFFVEGSNGGDSTMALPEDTVFPVTHTRQLLERAREGGRFLQSTLFIGGEEEDALYRVSGVIGNRKVESDPGLGALGEEGYWPVRLAYFDPASLESRPEYEIELDLQDNGVIRSYLVDYGDFSMAGSLQTIEALQEPDC